jgi:pimeloyl-ACP methyl ester carboxylesterase
MSSISTLPGITSERVRTPRLHMHVLRAGPPDGIPVVFCHGNGTTATFWEETMLALPAGFQGIAADMRAFGDTDPGPIDATLGLGDVAEDVHSLVRALGLGRYHLVGHSLGGGTAMKCAIAHPAALLSLTLVGTMSPYGYSGSKDAAGTPCHEDGAPAGAASTNPEAIRLLAIHDRGLDSPASPRNVLRQLYVRPPFVPRREEELLTAMLSLRLGPNWYPGDFVPSPHWPGAAPGPRGLVNAVSRRYFDASALADIRPQPPILWVRGAEDRMISNAALLDIAALGAWGLIPGWPGAEECPPQPMLDQIRYVLDLYLENGGTYAEHVIAGSGHSPSLEKPAEFNAWLHAFLLADGPVSPDRARHES